MARRVVLAAAALFLLAGINIAAQNQGALAIVGELDKVAARVKAPADAREQLRQLLADLRVLLEAPQPPSNQPPTIPTVLDSAGLVAALATGGTYMLAPGTYTGNFVATVPVNLTGAQLPETRVMAGATSGYKLVPEDPLKPTLTISGSGVHVTGVTIVPGAADRAVVQVGTDSATDPAQLPDDVVLDRIEITAGPNGGKRGIRADSRAFSLLRSQILGFWYVGSDAQAFLAINGPGPYVLDDNVLEGSGENVMFGGGSIKSAALIPSGIIVRRNLIRKPQDWRTRVGMVKNSLELKAANGAVVEDNVFDGCWKDAQAGHMIVLTPRNPDSLSPWVVVQDVTIRRNLSIRHTDGFAVSVLGTDDTHVTERTARVTIDHNYFADSPKGFILNRGINGIVIANNTLPAVKYHVLQFAGPVDVQTSLSFTANVSLAGDYGIAGEGTTLGVPTLVKYVSPLVWSSNIIERDADRSIQWPAGTTLLDPGTLAAKLDAEGHYTPGGAGW